MISSRIVGVACGLVVLWVTRAASADMIPIANASFESPAIASFGGFPDDWTLITGGGSGGALWNINDDPQGFWTTPAPDGKQAFAVITPPTGSSAIFSQVLTSTVQADTIYTLTGQVGSIALGAPDYAVTVMAGGAILGSTMGQAPFGSFVPFSVDFDSREGNALNAIGMPLEIQLRSLFRYAVFDDLKLEAVFIPEPGVFALAAIGLVCMGVGRRRVAL